MAGLCGLNSEKGGRERAEIFTQSVGRAARPLVLRPPSEESELVGRSAPSPKAVELSLLPLMLHACVGITIRIPEWKWNGIRSHTLNGRSGSAILSASP